MNSITTTRTGTFRLVAVLALAWNLIGFAMFWMQWNITPEQLAKLPDGQRAVHDAMPQWIWIANGIAVVSGVIASILLIMRKRLSVRFFWLSLVAIIVMFGYSFLVADMIAKVGMAEAVMMPIVVTAIAVALLWYARRARANGWLA